MVIFRYSKILNLCCNPSGILFSCPLEFMLDRFNKKSTHLVYPPWGWPLFLYGLEHGSG